jgi:hypothetical protein
MHDIPLTIKRKRPGRIVPVLVVAAIALLLTACWTSKATLRQQAYEHPTMTIGYWGHDWEAKPLHERIAPAPAELVAKILIENRIEGFSGKTQAAEPSPEFSAVLRRLGAFLPEKVGKLAAERIIGIYLVRDLGSSGYAEAIRDETGQERFAVIVLDRDLLLKRKANDWATWKEKSIFKAAPSRNIDLVVRIEEDAGNSVENAIEYILLHEIGHALGMAGGVHPSWNGAPSVDDWPFVKLSWRMNGPVVESLYDRMFSERPLIRPYAFGKSSLSMVYVGGVYRGLAWTNFPTLTAAAGIWEDFAESFANYLHVVRGKRPYEVRIRDTNVPDAVYSSCWNEYRCAAKRAFLEQWMEGPGVNAESGSTGIPLTSEVKK